MNISKEAEKIYSILVIEDNLPDYRMIEILLNEHDHSTFPFNYVLYHAQYLNQGVSLFEKTTFDIVLLDLNLPDSNGIDTVKKFISYIEGCPVIVLTGTNDMNYAFESIREGAEDYLIKGNFDSLLLVKTILYAIERYNNKKNVIEITVQENIVTSLRQLISDVAHDFRTPLSAISASLYLYGKTSKSEYLETISGQIHYLNDMLEDFLQLSKLDNETEVINMDAQNIVRLVKDLCADYSSIAEAKSKKLTLETTLETCVVSYDKKLLYRAFLNLISNAIKYTGTDGDIRVRAYTEEKHFIFEVEDNGIGIAAEDIPFVFDRFYRSDPARSSTTGGAGLGLSIAKKIIEIHHGVIEITSEINKGTKASIKLDISPEKEVSSLFSSDNVPIIL